MPATESIDSAPERAMTYCVVPRDLAPTLHEPLRAHFRHESVEVVVDRRAGERRAGADRRRGGSWSGPERRMVRNADGRRIADRRAPAVVVDPPALSRRLARHADQLVFLERIVVSDQRLEDIDTARLVTRFQAGDRDAFADLYMRYFDRLYAYLRVILGHPADAEEAVQQVFTNVLEALPGYEHRREPFRGWLFIVARNQAITLLRRSNRLEPHDPADLERERDEVVVDPPAPPAGDLGWITDAELMLFIERLPLAQRQVLALRYMLDMTHSQIAVVMERSPEDVRMLLSRAQAFLRARLSAIGRGPTAGRHGRAPLVRRPAHAYLLRARRFALMR